MYVYMYLCIYIQILGISSEENQEVVRLSLFQYIHEKLEYNHDRKNLLQLDYENIESNDDINKKINENKIKNLINKYEKKEKKEKILNPILSMNGFVFTISVHGCMVMSDRPVWERFAHGYKRESDVCTAAEKYEKYLLFKKKSFVIDGNINNENNDNTFLSYIRYFNSLDAVYGGIKELKNIKKLKKNMKNHKISNNMKNKINKYVPDVLSNDKDNLHKIEIENMEQPSLMWIDINFDEKFSKNNSDFDNHELDILINNNNNDNNDNVDNNNDNFNVIDEALNELYDVADERTMMIVLTQGDISALVELLSRKQRYVRIYVYIDKYMYIWLGLCIYT
jgi:hypothetical protein